VSDPEEPDCGRCNDDPRGALVLTEAGDYRETCPECSPLTDSPRAGWSAQAIADSDELPF
jgi:hypothetical protein